MRVSTRSQLLVAAMVVALTLFESRTAGATGLASGHYRFQATLSPVCLNGVYPFTIGEINSGCTLAVTTSVNGVVSGQLDLRTLKSPTIGRMTLKKNVLALTFATSGLHNTIKIASHLQGRSFAGTATTKTSTGPCTLDISSVTPLQATFDLTLAVDATGKVSGTGTAACCGHQFPVKVTGSNTPTACSLNVTGVGVRGFSWRGKGPPTDSGFTASWTASGFGIKQKGAGLAIATN